MFVVVLLRREPAPPEKVLRNTPREPDVEVSELFNFQYSGLSSSALAFIGDSNLFSPSRMSVDKKTTNLRQVSRNVKFELIGLMTLGDTLGAIILIPATRGVKQGKKSLYRVGEPIGKTGYQLLEVRPKEEVAVVGTATSQVSLKLERNDKGSLARRKKGEAEKRKVISITTKKVSNTHLSMAEKRRALLRRKSKLKRHLPARSKGAGESPKQ